MQAPDAGHGRGTAIIVALIGAAGLIVAAIVTPIIQRWLDDGPDPVAATTVAVSPSETPPLATMGDAANPTPLPTLAPTALPTFVPPPIIAGDYATTVDTTLLEAPDGTAAMVSFLPAGTTVTFTGAMTESADHVFWLEVTVPATGAQGWLDAQLVASR